ncbi:hypothetical protein ACJMK2_026355 [Sinanodonta woodiana]|uniref:Uncharacterized protein n=1 Tax=Sinanodonta woodiana TaxID=1069815 RepID=A0ABD3XMT5_SINWO
MEMNLMQIKETIFVIMLCSFKADFCEFVIWSSSGMIVERIVPDVEFWKVFCSNSINFHHNTLMQEYIEMGTPRHIMPVDLKI